jgi:hypothetical protein
VLDSFFPRKHIFFGKTCIFLKKNGIFGKKTNIFLKTPLFLLRKPRFWSNCMVLRCKFGVSLHQTYTSWGVSLHQTYIKLKLVKCKFDVNLHFKGGALSKTTNFVSWISSTNPCRAFAQLCFCPPLLFTSKTPSNLWFLFLKHIAARRPNKFHKMCFSWDSLACGLLPIPSKAEQSLRDLHFNPIFSR